ncbi:Uncharacterised protein [uncultured archaeon]|nr:Uncharacterised protein [uncultured archaeon]
MISFKDFDFNAAGIIINNVTLLEKLATSSIRTHEDRSSSSSCKLVVDVIVDLEFAPGSVERIYSGIHQE